jgi:hypothetical protein
VGIRTNWRQQSCRKKHTKVPKGSLDSLNISAVLHSKRNTSCAALQGWMHNLLSDLAPLYTTEGSNHAATLCRAVFVCSKTNLARPPCAMHLHTGRLPAKLRWLTSVHECTIAHDCSHSAQTLKMLRRIYIRPSADSVFIRRAESIGQRITYDLRLL